jgi:hypothetical protein
VRENHPDQNPGKEEDVRPVLLGSNESEKAAKNRIMRCQCGRLDEIGNAFDAKPPKIGLPC